MAKERVNKAFIIYNLPFIIIKRTREISLICSYMINEHERKVLYILYGKRTRELSLMFLKFLIVSYVVKEHLSKAFIIYHLSLVKPYMVKEHISKAIYISHVF